MSAADDDEWRRKRRLPELLEELTITSAWRLRKESTRRGGENEHPELMAPITHKETAV